MALWPPPIPTSDIVIALCMVMTMLPVVVITHRVLAKLKLAPAPLDTRAAAKQE